MRTVNAPFLDRPVTRLELIRSYDNRLQYERPTSWGQYDSRSTVALVALVRRLLDTKNVRADMAEAPHR